MTMKLVLLGTGTPNACPNNSGPSSAVVVDDQAYLIDFGPGVVRQCSKAYYKGVDALRPNKLTIAFSTHLHSDHTLGLADLIFTPWVLERKAPLTLIGPKGLKHMADCIEDAYVEDIRERLEGTQPANPTGYKTEVKELDPNTTVHGIVYQDDKVQVEAFTVDHGSLQSLAYKFTDYQGHTILLSGDTRPLDLMKEAAKDVDILVHEVEYSAGLSQRTPDWQIYHKKVHTMSTSLADIALAAKPKLVVTNHRIYHMEIQNNTKDLDHEMAWRNEAILQEIKDAGYDGQVVNGEDIDIFTIEP